MCLHIITVLTNFVEYFKIITKVFIGGSKSVKEIYSKNDMFI